MLTGLLEFKEKLKAFYAKGGVYIKHFCYFLLAFLSMFIVSRMIGGDGIISSPLICIALAIICAFLHINVTVVVTTVYIVIHLFSLSLELAVIALGRGDGDLGTRAHRDRKIGKRSKGGTRYIGDRQDICSP